MATLNLSLGRIMFQTQGSWSVATAYVVDDIVYANGLTFICTTNNTNQNPILAQTDYASRVNTQYWNLMSEGFNFRGSWANNTIYYPNDVVSAGNTFGGTYGSYLCRKKHTSSLYNRDLWYNPSNEWDEFTRSGATLRPREQTKLIGNMGPIGWKGNPFVQAPTWGTSNSWQGNIPWNIPQFAKRWEFNPSSGKCHAQTLTSSYRVSKDGRPQVTGTPGNYMVGYDNDAAYGARELDPSFKPDYYSDSNPTGGFRGKTWRTDTSIGEPTVVQQCLVGQYGWMHLFSNGTVVSHVNNDQGASGLGYGAVGEAFPGRSGTRPVIFPPGTFIVKIAHSAEANQDYRGHCLALDSEGNLWAWGSNYNGQLGIGSEPGFSPPRINGSLGDLNNTTTGNYIFWEGRPTKIPSFAFNNAKIVDMWCEGNYTFGTSWALDEYGNMWAWGSGQYGQLGYDVTNAVTGNMRNANMSTVPQKMGYVQGGSTGTNWASYGGIQKVMINNRDSGGNDSAYGIFILDGQGYLWYAGYNIGYVLGDNTNTTATSAFNNSLPYRISFPAGYNLNGNIINVWSLAGSTNPITIVQRNDGVCFAWGYNGTYALGDGTITNRNYPNALLNIGNTSPVLAISSGGATTTASVLALISVPQASAANTNYRILGVGNNGVGQLGTGEPAGTQATGGAQSGGMFHRIYSGGALTSLYAFQPMSLPGGVFGGKIRAIRHTGNAGTSGLQILFENGMMYQTGSQAAYQITALSAGGANLMKKPTGTF